MSPVRNQLVQMIDCLPDQEQLLLFEIVKRFVPDDAAAPDDLEDIYTARTEYVNGETISHNAIKWD